MYDPSTNSWTSHSEPNIVHDIEESFVLDGKIYIRCSVSSTTSLYTNLQVAFGSTQIKIWFQAGPAIVVEGNPNLFVFDKSCGPRLMMWEKRSREWVCCWKTFSSADSLQLAKTSSSLEKG
ncbi:hypothetical protein MKX01_035271 [Papaver californicum]|nr:hypothetical protein MKX01_035271 [Papaver californicum]